MGPQLQLQAACFSWRFMTERARYNSTRGSVLGTILYHHSIHVASLVPVIPGIQGTVVMAIVSVAAAATAVAASGGSLVGLRRGRLAGPAVEPGLP
jgi:hypothetical protein